MTDLEPLGDRAFLARFQTEDEAAAWSSAVRSRAQPGVLDVVLAYHTAAVYADPSVISLATLEAELKTISPAVGNTAEGRLIEIPVLYQGEDLAEIAVRLGVSSDELVRLHTATVYRVFAIGFQPGFPYAGYLPAPLSGLARRETPRVRVPAGSVAIVGRQTGIYPSELPGGWHLLGRTPLSIVDVEHGRFPIRAGDQIRFASISEPEFNARLGEPLT